MAAVRLPPRAAQLVKCFLEIHERIDYYLNTSESQETIISTSWIAELCTPTYEEIAVLFDNIASLFTSLGIIRLLYQDKRFKDIRDRHIRLVEVVEAQIPPCVLEELFKHIDKFTAEDRARSFLLLASEIPSSDEQEDKLRVNWINRITESLETSPRVLRPQLLLAASIIGHEPMVTLLLHEIATDEKPLVPNMDDLKAECLIEAARNLHFSIVKKLLDDGRFSNGNETRTDAVVQALEMSCTNGSTDLADILLPLYLSHCSYGKHHPRLLRLALSNWHFEIVERLLKCDPRGSLCNMMQLIDTLREEVAQSPQDSVPSSFIAIVLGEDHDDLDVLSMWDVAKLVRGISSENPTLVRFLVNHVNFSLEALTAALETAENSENVEIFGIMSSKLREMAGPNENVEAESDTESDAGDVSPSVNLINSSSPIVALAIVRQFSSQTVDYILCKGKLAVIQHAGTTEALADNSQIIVKDSIGEEGVDDLKVCDPSSHEDYDPHSYKDELSVLTAVEVLVTHLADLESNINSEALLDSCWEEAQFPKPQEVTPLITSQAASPSRSTIICPVRWEQHSTDIYKTSNPTNDIPAQLREGDHVEVHYKGRSVVFPGVVAFCHSSGVYDIVYEDGEDESCVPREFIQLVEPAPIVSCHILLSKSGEHVEVLASGEQEAVDKTYLQIETGPSPMEHLPRDENSLEEPSQCSNNPATSMCDSIKSQVNEYNSSEKAAKGNCTVLSTTTMDQSKSYLSEVLPEMTLDTYSINNEGRSSQSDQPQLTHARGTNSDTESGNDNALRITADCGLPALDSSDLKFVSRRSLGAKAIVIECLPELPSIFVLNEGPEQAPVSRKGPFSATRTSQWRLRERGLSVSSQRSRCRTIDNTSSEEMTEWKNVDLLLNRRRRLFQTQTGSIETTKVPWGEEFASIQSLKRFTAEHPDILRAHIENQLRELDGPLMSTSPGKSHSSRVRHPSAHSGAGQARSSLLLMKDLAFLLQHRLAPFFDTIVPVVMTTVFNTEKRFLCETATEVLDAMILHCSGRKLALLFLQLSETYSKHEDLRLYNLASVYAEKCIQNWNKSESLSLLSSQSTTTLLTLLAKLLISKSAAVRISGQKSWSHLREELGTRNFEAILRMHLSQELENVVLREYGDSSISSPESNHRRNSSRRRERGKENDTQSPTIVQKNSPSILQRMLLHRQNRVLPKQS